MLKDLFGTAEKMGWTIATFIAMLVLSYGLLHLLASRLPEPYAGYASDVAGYASGSVYGY